MEDQGVLGTIWNKEATRLLSLFGWNTIGDYDMDVQGKDDKQYGIDTLITFKTPLKNNKQIAILEAKRYEIKNFNKSLLQGWIERLDKKLIELRNSEKFQERFPDLSECSTLDMGIIAIWFHDTRNYYDFHSKFIEILQNISVSGRTRKVGMNKIFVIDNHKILRLCSMHKSIEAYESDNDDSKIFFYYPPILIEDKPIVREQVLTIEFIFSDIVLAEARKDKVTVENIVFYFGKLEIPCFHQLKSLLTLCSFLDTDKPLLLYIYQEDDEFRKIEPDIKRIFENVSFRIKSMDNLFDLPGYIKDIVLE